MKCPTCTGGKKMYSVDLETLKERAGKLYHEPDPERSTFERWTDLVEFAYKCGKHDGWHEGFDRGVSERQSHFDRQTIEVIAEARVKEQYGEAKP